MEINIINRVLNIPDFFVTELSVTEDEVCIKGTTPKETECSDCKKKTQKRHTSKAKRVRHLDMCGKATYLEFEHPSIHCEHCGSYFVQPLSFITISKHHSDKFVMEILKLARASSLAHVSLFFRESYSNIERVYYRYLLKQQKAPIKSANIGIDEIALKKGHNNFVLIIYDLDSGVVLDILLDRKQSTLKKYIEDLPEESKNVIRNVCIDMWRPYRECIRKLLPCARLVIDRFHVARELNKAVDKVRCQLLKEGKFKSLSGEDRKKLTWAVRYSTASLKKHPAYRKVLRKALAICPQLRCVVQLRNEFKALFDLKQAHLARARLSNWMRQVTKSKLTPLLKFLKTFRNWKTWIMNFFPFRYTNAPAEGLNTKIKLIKRLGFGFNSFFHFRMRILHTCGVLG